MAVRNVVRHKRENGSHWQCTQVDLYYEDGGMIDGYTSINGYYVSCFKWLGRWKAEVSWKSTGKILQIFETDSFSRSLHLAMLWAVRESYRIE